MTFDRFLWVLLTNDLTMIYVTTFVSLLIGSFIHEWWMRRHPPKRRRRKPSDDWVDDCLYDMDVASRRAIFPKHKVEHKGR